jgi:hypothetical protein
VQTMELTAEALVAQLQALDAGRNA